jgi:uncharacterized membrane protein
VNLLYQDLSLATLVGGWVVALLTLFWAVKTADWDKVVNDRGAQHVLLGASVVLFLVWHFDASIENGASFHFLLMTLMTLMFTPQFALLGMFLALVGLTFVDGLGWQAIGLNALIMGVIPVVVTWTAYRLGAKFLEANFFVYVFYNGFLSAALGVVVSLGFASFILGLNEVMTMQELEKDFIPYIILLAMPEGFLNGFLIAAFVLLKPTWVATFNDKTYLSGK